MFEVFFPLVLNIQKSHFILCSDRIYAIFSIFHFISFQFTRQKVVKKSAHFSGNEIVRIQSLVVRFGLPQSEYMRVAGDVIVSVLNSCSIR